MWHNTICSLEGRISVVSSVSSCGALRIASWRSPKAPEMKAQKAKNSKMEAVPALINSLYGRLGATKFFVWELGKTDYF